MNAFSEYAAGRFNEAMLKQNARMAEAQAVDAIERGRKDEQNYRKQVRGMIGSQRVAYASQGVQIDSGSALDVQADTAAIGEEDALTIRNNAAREAWGYRVDAANMKAQAKQAKRQGTMRAVGSLLQAGGSAAGSGGFGG